MAACRAGGPIEASAAARVSGGPSTHQRLPEAAPVVYRRLPLPMASGKQQLAGQKRQQHAPPRRPPDLLQRPLTLIITSKTLLRCGYNALEMNHYQAVQ
jgi:hypothetical protein